MPAAATYSIAACDLDRREWGVAVESKFLAIGAVTPWAEADVGAIATQAWINIAFGHDGLDLLRGGRSAQESVEALVGADEGRDLRQLGIVDREGRAASYTGSGCLAWAGSRGGRGFTVQGNTLVSAETVDAMAEAFESRVGSLADRLLAALRAGHDAGGDRRGRQASALYVVRRGGGYGGSDIAVDLRVDDDPDPLGQLERLYALHDLYFGSTPADEWLPVGPELRAEIRKRLAQLGYASGDLGGDLDAWAGAENLEERVHGVERIDPVVLAHLRGR